VLDWHCARLALLTTRLVGLLDWQLVLDWHCARLALLTTRLVGVKV
jgi:hypothetical protein